MDPRLIEYREAAARAVGILAMLDANLAERVEVAVEEIAGLDGSGLPPDLALAWKAALAYRTSSKGAKPRYPVLQRDDPILQTAGRLLSLWRDLLLLTQGQQ